MAGTKGRSGRVATPEHRRAKQLAGQKGGQAKAGHRPQPSVSGLTGAPPLDVDALAKLLPGKNAYDKAVLSSGGRFTYLEAKTREQVRGEELANEKARVAIDRERGALFTREQVEARDEEHDRVIMDHLSELPDAVGKMVPPELSSSVRGRVQEWILAMQNKVADALEAPAK